VKYRTRKPFMPGEQGSRMLSPLWRAAVVTLQVLRFGGTGRFLD